MKVLIPGPLRSYTKEREVEASGATLAEVIGDLERRYPGLRFRVIDEQDQIRTHMKLFVNTESARDLDHPVRPSDEVTIVCALSGG